MPDGQACKWPPPCSALTQGQTVRVGTRRETVRSLIPLVAELYRIEFCNCVPFAGAKFWNNRVQPGQNDEMGTRVVV